MVKITLLGAGSGFTQPLFTDILNIEGLDQGVIGMVDIDAARLDINIKLMRRVLDLMGRNKWRIEASTDRQKILKGTNYLVSTIEVSGVNCVRWDNDIPLKYGIDQCIGDTIGPGGVMKALRTLPALVEILEDAGRLCPEALVLNYTNPMSIITLGANRATSQPFVGLCHSVQGNSREIAQILNVPYDELEWQCGGINHMAWFTVLRWKGRDMHMRLRAAAEDPSIIEAFPVRTDLIRNLGYFSTESCGHFSEYVPYYRKRKDLLRKHCRPGYRGESGFYARNWPDWRRAVDRRRRDMAAGKCEIPLKRGLEYAADIVEAHLFDRKKVIYASVPNTGLIPNLPQTGVVEVATLVDRRGFSPTHFGNLPEQCAALCRANMAVFELCAQGILNRDREAVIHSMMVDPLSAAVCSLSEIRAMAEELFKAERDFIPAWCRKPKASPVPLGRRWTRVTDYARTIEISRLMPHRAIGAVGYPKDQKPLRFKTRAFLENFCNLNPELEKAGPALVFFRCRIRCGVRMRLAAKLGYDGPLKAWVDGREVYCDPEGTNPARPDAAAVEFAASRGRHEIMVALDSNNGKAWGIFLRFTRLDVSDGKVAAGLPPSQMPEILDQARVDQAAVVSSMAAQVTKEKRGKRRK